MSKYIYPAVVPQLVEDKTLKRSRIDITDDTSAIRVTSTTSTDLTPLGETDDAAWNGTDPDATVISLLKGIVNKFN